MYKVSNTEENKQSSTPNKIEETTTGKQLSGLIIKDLLNPKFLELFNQEKIELSPFLIGLEIGSGTILIISHHSPKDVENKTIYIEVKHAHEENPADRLQQTVDIIKKMV